MPVFSIFRRNSNNSLTSRKIFLALCLYCEVSHWLSVLFACTARTSRDVGTLSQVIVERAAWFVWAGLSCIDIVAFQCDRRGLKENCGSGCWKFQWRMVSALNVKSSWRSKQSLTFDIIRSYSMIHVAPGLGWQYLTCNMAMNYLLTKYYCPPTYYKRDTLLGGWIRFRQWQEWVFWSLWREHIRLRLWLWLLCPSGPQAVWPKPLSIT